MTKSKFLGLALSGVLTLTLACVAVAAPTTSADSVETIVAATMLAIKPEASTTATAPSPAVPTGTSVPILPLVGPTPLPIATRINFLTNATTGVVSESIQGGQSIYFVLQAAQAQVMLVRVDSMNRDVAVSLRTQGGTSFLNAASHHSSWQGMLPQTEDYYIGVHGGASTENFILTVEIASPIKFASGSYLAKVTGQTVAGYNVAYAVFAVKGQKMSVDLTGMGSDGALTIYGFEDGQPYLRSETQQTSFSFKLPSTQDYIIEVVPQAGKVLNYTLVVKAQ